MKRVLPGHPDMRAIGGGRWKCVDCKREGSLADLNAAACPAVEVGPLTPDEHLREWAAGRPSCPNSVGECCPDFSCCHPHLLAPVEVREAYVRAPQSERQRWCMQFLGALTADAKVHITRGKPKEDIPS